MVEEFKEGTARIIKTEETFFNPAQKLNRDISAAVIRAYFDDKKSIRILTSMSATGLRGIRYLNEIQNSTLYFNDICPKAVESIASNLKLNNFEDFKIFNHSDNLRQSSERINITQSDCHVIMNKYHSYFDVIDIDPFGSCSEFVNSAFKGIKHNGLICFTCTDKAALCSNVPKCYMKYNSMIKKVFCKNETPIRVLLSYISREFAKYDAKIIPVLSLSVDFYVRVIVRVFKGQGKSVLNDNAYVGICNCHNMKTIPLSKPISPDCEHCQKQIQLYGPFWIGGIHDKSVIDRMLNDNPPDGNERMIGILRLMKQEIPALFYYEMPVLSSILKLNCCKLRNIMNALANANYQVSLTHCDNNSFKTDAAFDIVKKIMIQANSNQEGEFSFEQNDKVTAIFDQNYFKGMIASGLKPLSLPKKSSDSKSSIA